GWQRKQALHGARPSMQAVVTVLQLTVTLVSEVANLMAASRHLCGVASIIATLAQQHLALANMIGRADDPFGLHLLHQAGCPVVADLQLALDEGGGGLAVACHHLHGPAIELLVRATLTATEAGNALFLAFRFVGQSLD